MLTRKPPGGLACGSFGLSRGSIIEPFEPQTASLVIRWRLAPLPLPYLALALTPAGANPNPIGKWTIQVAACILAPTEEDPQALEWIMATFARAHAPLREGGPARFEVRAEGRWTVPGVTSGTVSSGS